jgi:solute:Na+ symporter, SSS family
MSSFDWIVLGVTLCCIIVYGIYKSRTSRNLDGYFLSNREMPWYIILLSIMGTQASAITFLSAPGQAYTDGMRFVQYYFGLPLAMIIICIAFVPIFHRLKIYTAYEYLERRFDVKTRTFTSFLFLISRGLSTGISVYAPSIILSSLLGWNIYLTNIFMGGLLIIYTVSGGAKAVAYTQQLQLIIIFLGLFLAAYTVVTLLPEGVGFKEALQISGKLGKLNVITTGISEKGFDWTDRYNLFSGLIGGLFFSLSYFGTDQSQVGRYLTAKSLKESRMGLLMNGLVKVPMQFGILLIGALVFAFYQFKQAPIFFNQSQVEKIRTSAYSDSLKQIENEFAIVSALKQQYTRDLFSNGVMNNSRELDQKIRMVNQQSDSLRAATRSLIKKADATADNSDTNYIFLRFVVDYLPKGLVGLLVSVIFLASWGSIAAALNSLASASVVDFHKKFFNKNLTPEQDYRISRWYSLGWGLFCIVTAQFATGMGSLIEAVNVLGSWFYGVILGIFLVAFYLKSIKGSAVFWAGILAEIVVLTIYRQTDIGWLWLTAIGALGVILFALLLQATIFRNGLAPGKS